MMNSKFDNELNRVMRETYIARKIELIRELRELNDQLDKLSQSNPKEESVINDVTCPDCLKRKR